MASAWGYSWGSAWGNSWGTIASDNTVVTLGADRWRIRKQDDDDPEILGLIQKIIPMAVAHRTGIKVRK